MYISTFLTRVNKALRSVSCVCMNVSVCYQYDEDDFIVGGLVAFYFYAPPVRSFDMHDVWSIHCNRMSIQ